MIIWSVYHRYCCKYAQIRRVRNSLTVVNVEVPIVWYFFFAIGLKFCGTVMSTVIYYTKVIPCVSRIVCPLVVSQLVLLELYDCSIRVQWNPSKMDTIGEMKYVLYMEVSLFKWFSKILK